MCRQFRVSGRVQGVFFRVSTRDVAVPLGLTGHARNLPEGSVEVVACGDRAAVAELARWLSGGPQMASVSGVAATDIECAAPAHFTIS